MTAQDAASEQARTSTLIGQVGSLRVDSGPMYLDVRIVAYKRSYGTERVFVEPVAGRGGVWVNLDRLNLY